MVICHVFCSCSSSTDNVIEESEKKEQAHLEGVFNANSVIVHSGSKNWYGIDISRANTFWSNPDVGDASNVIDNSTQWTAEVIWQDIDRRAINFCGADGKVIGCDTINGKGLQPLYIKAATSTPGNVVVGIKKKGAGSDAYLWSWHLWITEEPKEIAGFMDRNLGATSVSPSGGSKAYGLLYQFGRKDPFIGNNYNQKILAKYDINGRFIYGGDKKKVNRYTFFSQYVNSPNVIISSDDYGRFETPEEWTKWENQQKYMDKEWNDITDTFGKTLFDPSPEGWRLSTKEDLEKLTLDERHVSRFVFDEIFRGYALDGNWFPQDFDYWSTGYYGKYRDNNYNYVEGFRCTIWSFNNELIRKSNRYNLNHVRCIKM